MRNQRLTKINIVEGEEQAIGEAEANSNIKEEEIKEEEVVDLIITTIITEEATIGTDIEKTARRNNLGKITHPKNLLQAVEGVRKIKRKAQ